MTQKNSIDFGLLEDLFKRHNIKEIKRIVNCHNVNDVNHSGAGVALYACKYGHDDPEALLYFASIGIQQTLLENASFGFWAPIHRAAIDDKMHLVRSLVRLGVPINLYDSSRTPLDAMFEQVIKYNVKSCIELVDMGAKTYFPHEWIHDFTKQRQRTRHASIIVLGLQRCFPNTLQGNGKDVLRMIARCLWSLRGINEKKF